MIRLLSAIAKVMVLLSKGVQSVRENAKSDDSREKPDPLQSEIRLPVAITEYYKSEQEERKCKGFRSGLVICIEIVALGTALSLAILTWRTVQEINTQGKIMKDQILADNRPWVSVDISITDDLEFGTPMGSLGLMYLMKNHGRSPAVGVYISSTVYLWRPGGKEIVAEQSRWCEMARQDPTMNSIGGETLFPDQERSNPIIFSVSKGAIDNSLYLLPSGMLSEWISPFIVGCISYRFTFDNSLHQTPFIFQITMRSSEGSIQSPKVIRIDKGKIPAKMLLITQTTIPGERIAD